MLQPNNFEEKTTDTKTLSYFSTQSKKSNEIKDISRVCNAYCEISVGLTNDTFLPKHAVE